MALTLVSPRQQSVDFSGGVLFPTQKRKKKREFPKVRGLKSVYHLQEDRLVHGLCKW